MNLIKNGSIIRFLLNKNSDNIIMKYIQMPSALNNMAGFRKK